MGKIVCRYYALMTTGLMTLPQKDSAILPRQVTSVRGTYRDQFGRDVGEHGPIGQHDGEQ